MGIRKTKLDEEFLKLYLATYIRKDDSGIWTAVKVGVTRYVDWKSRDDVNHWASYNNPEDIMKGLVSWKDFFNIGRKVVKSVKLPAEGALIGEKKILRLWGPEDLKDILPPMSGKTEFRKYTQERYSIAADIIEDYRSKWNDYKEKQEN